jgi:hypothetical protein
VCGEGAVTFLQLMRWHFAWWEWPVVVFLSLLT